MLRILLASSLLAVLAVLSGCNTLNADRPQCYPVRGKVLTADGQPLPGGRVEFYPKDGQGGEPVASGEIARDGTFVIGTYTTNDGTNPGTYIVTVLPVTYKTGNPTQAVPARLVPKQYLEPETSGLIAEVKAEDNMLAPFVLR